MRILFLTSYYPPEGGSAARLAGELAGFLHGRGHDVVVLAPVPSYNVQKDGEGGWRPEARGRREDASDDSSVALPSPGSPMRSPPVRRYGLALPSGLPHLLQRGVEHGLRPWFAAFEAARGLRPDLVYVFCPTAAQFQVARLLAWSAGCPCVIHLQDLFPDNLVDVGVLREGAVTALLRRATLESMRHAATVFVHCPTLAEHLAPAGIRAVHAPNWVDCRRFAPPPAEAGSPLFPHLAGKVVALHAGVLGLAQGVEELAALAGALREMKELHFVVAGDGPRREWLATAIRRDGLPNVTLVPMVPAVEYPALVRRCDLFLSFLSPAIRYPVIPSKLGDGMAAGKPILAALPAGDARRLVEEAGAGLVVSPGDLPGLVAAASRLVESSAVRRHLGAGGRAYAVRRLDLGVVLSELACVLGG